MDEQADLESQQTLVGERDLSLHFGVTITRLRNARGWKQNELARRAGLHPARLSRLLQLLLLGYRAAGARRP
jgi:ribosome-binding protein aMBF1 (putative translation factor)